jgi:hypothetical protein
MYHDVTREPDAESANPESQDEDKAEKKERVLHTRIPAVLEAELKQAAKALRVPVSNLVRTILEDAIAVADRATGQVEERLNRVARTVGSERERIRTKFEKRDPLAHVVAFQSVVVAAAAHCAKCDQALEAGDDAALAILDSPGPNLFVCSECMPKRKH